MSVKLKYKGANTLEEEMKSINKWNNSSLPFVIEYKTVEDFYHGYIEPRLPDSETVKKWTELLLEYVEDKNAVYAIRKYGDWVTFGSNNKNNKPQNSDECLENDDVSKDDNDLCKEKFGEEGKKLDKRYVNPFTLRRGFLTEFTNDGHKFTYFFTDNNFAKYFTKMAFDGFVPGKEELKQALQDRSFSARYGIPDEYEIKKAAYDINGKIMKAVELGHYLGHIIDTGQSFVKNDDVKNIEDICKTYFPRGSYNEWKDYTKEGWQLINGYSSNLTVEKIPGLNYVRKMEYIGGLDYLKSHFLRFVCPINHFLVPKTEFQGQNENALQGYYRKNVAEVKELQEYIIGKFYEIYGDLYERYLGAIMWTNSNAVKEKLENIIKHLHQKGEHVLDFGYAPNYAAQKVKKYKDPNIRETPSWGAKTVNNKHQNSTSQSNAQNRPQKISYDPSLVTKKAADRKAYLLNGVSNNYIEKNGLKKITEINGIVNSLFSGKSLFDLTNVQDIINVWKEVKKQSWNDKTGRGIPAAIVSNYCIAVTGKVPGINLFNQ